MFEKISKINRLAKLWRKKIHVNKTIHERDNITVGTEEIQRIIMENFKSLYSNKFRNLKKGILFSTQTKLIQISRLNQDKINDLNRSLTSNKIEVLIKIYHPRKA